MRTTSILTIATLIFAALMSLAGTAAAHQSPATPSSDDIPANLVPPADAILLFELSATGVQIYSCEADPEDDTEFVWTFKAPEADLLNRHGELVGTHFAGPTWQGHDGSSVVGAVLERADSPDTGAIPWLLLEATEHTGSGAFSTITYVQRLDTVGGVAPDEGCDADHAGDEVRQPYEATYAFFYPSTPAATPTT